MTIYIDSPISVGHLQYDCLRSLWKLGPSLVRAVWDDLNTYRPDDRDPLAYTTILTVMRNLNERGLVARDKSGNGRGRTHVYRAVMSDEAFHAMLAKRFLDEYFHGDASRFQDALARAKA